MKRKYIIGFILGAITFIGFGAQAATCTGIFFGGTGICYGNGYVNGFTANSILLGNGSNPFATTSAGTNGQVLALVSGVPTWQSTTTLSTISGTLAVNKGGTGQTTFTSSQLLYGNGTSALSSAATTTVSFSGPFTIGGGLGALVGGANSTITWSGLATTSQPASSNLLVSNGAAGVYGVATTSETCTSPLSCTAHTVLGGGGAITLGTVTVDKGGTGQVSFTSSQLLYGNGTNALSGVATTTQSFSGPFTVTGPQGALVGGSNSTVTWSGLATSTAIAANQVLYGTGASGVGSEAAFTYTASTDNLAFLFASSTSISSSGGAWFGTSGGNVGIGTSTPNWFLQVAGARPSIAISDTAQTPASNLQHWLISSMGGELYIGTSTGSLGTSTRPALAISNGGQVNTYSVQPATSTAMTLNWSNTPNQVEYRIGVAATTITLVNATTSDNWGSRKLVPVCNPNGTAGALTWVGVEWIGTAPAQTTTANQCDVYSFAIVRATSTSAYKVMGSAGSGLQ